MEATVVLEVALGLVALAAVAALVAALRAGRPAAGLAAPIGQLRDAVGGLTVELRGLGERVLTLERGQARVQHGVSALGTGLVEASMVTRTLAETAAAIRSELARAQQDLVALGAQAAAARDLDRRTAESVRRLETVIAGTQTKGAAGEQILEAVFARLPVEWQVRNLRVGDRTVEFGLRLPNDRVLPIDSKWPATPLVEQLAVCDDPAERQRLKVQIEAVVLARAREVRKYLDPTVTVGFGVAALPDAVYDLCAGIHADAFQASVVLVSYSLFVPYLLLVFQTTLRHSRQIDLQKLEAYLGSAARSLAGLQEELDGRLAKAITMLQNSRAEMGAQLAKVAGGLAGLRPGPGATRDGLDERLAAAGAPPTDTAA